MKWGMEPFLVLNRTISSKSVDCTSLYMKRSTKEHLLGSLHKVLPARCFLWSIWEMFVLWTYRGVCWSCCWVALQVSGPCSSHCPPQDGSEPESSWSLWSSPDPHWDTWEGEIHNFKTTATDIWSPIGPDVAPDKIPEAIKTVVLI